MTRSLQPIATRRTWRIPTLHLLLGAAVVLGACTGNIGSLPGGGDGLGTSKEAQCAVVEPGESPIRRMTRTEYNNTIRDLLNDDSKPADAFVVEEEALGFNNQATALGVTQLLAEQYMQASETIAATAALDLDALLPCDPAVAGQDACATEFIESFGKRAWRRPLQPAEVSRLEGVFTWGVDNGDFSTGIQLVMQAMLQSPHFLYRVEFGLPDPVEGDVVALDHYEIATRLSYMIWNTMPDPELTAAADAGLLGTPDEIAAQARRMLDHENARQAVANFHTQWLQLGTLATVSKDPVIYPAYDDALRPLWRQETEAFLDYVVFEGEGDVNTLLTADYTLVNSELAGFYGIDGVTGEDFQKVSIDTTQRAGFLTHASVLATQAKPNQSSPVHRGKFVRERLLCQILPLPPNDIDIEPPDIDPNATTREKFAEHSENEECRGCHVLMDPIGFGFENFDGIGQWRSMDHGIPVDASGELLQTHDPAQEGPFVGAVELAHKLASSDQVRECVATQWFRFGYGRAESEADKCTVEQVQGAFADSGYNIKELLVALTQTDAFGYRHAVVAGGE